MPRIDPLQLLKCLSVLLTPEGGILSREEVPRLVNLMTKFSKKLVSKCVYVLILKNTETELVDMFMAEGGWALIQTWLQDAVQTSNWDLVREILGLLLVTPVDVERLKLNILPKLIKSLSRREELEGVAQLSTQLVQQWLSIVKGSSAAQAQQAQIAAEKAENKESSAKGESIQPEINDAKEKTDQVQGENLSEGINTNSFYKTTGKDGKLIIRRLSNETDKQEGVVALGTSEETVKAEKVGEEKKEDKSKSSSSKSSRNSRSSSSNRDKDRHNRDKERDRDKDRKTSSSSKRTSSSSSKSRGSSSSKDKDKKDRDKERDKDKDKHRSNGELKTSSSSSSSKDKKDGKEKEKDKEKQAEKDKDTLAKIKPPTIDKLGRIPKKVIPAPAVDEKKDLKKKSFSIGIRKDSEERPKTVKVFNSKMRSTGLEEEIKPAPPRPVKKPTPSVQLPTIPMKRPSPPKELRDPIAPLEKKLKIDKLDVPDRPGAIKLIPPKPKRTHREAGESYQTPKLGWKLYFFFADQYRKRIVHGFNLIFLSLN